MNTYVNPGPDERDMPTDEPPEKRKERPILFSALMIRAILAGTKTQTRRVINPKPTVDHLTLMPGGELVGICPNGNHVGDGPAPKRGWMRSPYGIAGDHLWVRESAWMDKEIVPQLGYKRAFFPDTNEVRHPGYIGQSPFKLSEDVMACGGLQRKVPSIHVPRWASRITLEVTELRVQRLQDISEEDAQSEGVTMADANFNETCDVCGETADGCECGQPQHRFAFKCLWNEINSRRGFHWESNPYVWCVSFRKVAQ